MAHLDLGAAASRSDDLADKAYVDAAVAGAGSGPSGETRTATSAGTLTLTSTSKPIQVLTGTTTHTVKLPTTGVLVASTPNQWMVVNESTGAVTVQSSDATTALILASNTSGVFTAAQDTPTAPSHWDIQYGGVSVATGKVLKVDNSLELAGVDNTIYKFSAMSDAAFKFANSTDATKLLGLDLSAITTANTRTLTAPDLSGALQAEAFITLTSAYTLTSQTAAQKLFNSPTNGAVTVSPGTYFFECLFTLSSMSATSGAFGFALGGTATIAGQLWLTEANKAALATAASAQNSVNTAANTAIVTATVNTVGWARIEGKIRVSAAGTIIPQVSLGVAAAAIVGVDSFFAIRSMGSSTVQSAGPWT